MLKKCNGLGHRNGHRSKKGYSQVSGIKEKKMSLITPDWYVEVPQVETKICVLVDNMGSAVQEDIGDMASGP